MNTTAQKKICIVGCGAIANVHAKHLRARAELHFVSRRRESAEAFCASFGGTAVYDNYEQALDANIDGVVLCTPPEYHVAQATAALQRGKGVLVEKPLCANPNELSAMGQAIAAHPNIPFLVAENYYYKPSLRLLQWIIAQGFIGALQSIHVRKCFTQHASGWKSGYGALLEGGIHFVALISALVGQEPQRVAARFPGGNADRAERRSEVRMEYADGLCAQLHYAWNAFSPTKGVLQHSRIDGESGYIVFESNGLYVRLKSRARKRIYFPGLRDLMGYAGQARDFLACLHDPARAPISGFVQAQRDLSIVFEAYRELQEKRR